MNEIHIYKCLLDQKTFYRYCVIFYGNKIQHSLIDDLNDVISVLNVSSLYDFDVTDFILSKDKEHLTHISISGFQYALIKKIKGKKPFKELFLEECPEYGI